jgi:hypothetical protein
MTRPTATDLEDVLLDAWSALAAELGAAGCATRERTRKRGE